MDTVLSGKPAIAQTRRDEFCKEEGRILLTRSPARQPVASGAGNRTTQQIDPAQLRTAMVLAPSIDGFFEYDKDGQAGLELSAAPGKQPTILAL